MLKAKYWIETPLPVEQAAESMAGEQSSGTFLKLKEETDAFNAAHKARIDSLTVLDQVSHPSLPGAKRPSQTVDRPYTQAEVTLSWPETNIDPGLQTLLATVAGNLFELSAFSGLKLLDVELPESFAKNFAGPRKGIEGTRSLANVFNRPLLGTIIKPSVGLTPEQCAQQVENLAESGLDFLKDDELQGDSAFSPFEKRVESVMAVLNAYADKTGRKPMYAFNLSGDIDQMKRRHDCVLRNGGTCIMASIQWVGLSGMQALAEHSELPIHGHRNGWGLYSRSDAVGLSYIAWQKFCRLAGVDHLHCNGLRNKFCESDESVVQSARACLSPISRDSDRAMPVISSGQWAGNIPDTYDALDSPDFMFLCGGGVMGHPSGAKAGVMSLRQAWEAAERGIPLNEYATDHTELNEAMRFFKRS